MKQKTLETINRRCDKVSVFGFYALSYFLPITSALTEWSFAFIFLPFVYKRTALFVHHVMQNPPQNIQTVYQQFIRSYRPVRNILNRPIGLYVLLCFISVMFSDYRMVAFRSFVFSLLQCVYIYLVFVEVMVIRKRLKVFLSIFLISFTLIGINGLFQYFSGAGFIHHHLLKDQRVMSSFKHPNDFGSYLVMLLPLILSLTLFFKRERKTPSFPVSSVEGEKNIFLSKMFQRLTVIVFIIGVAGLGLTFSRGAWVGFIVALIFLSFLRSRKIVFILVIIALFLGVFYPQIITTRHVSFTSDRASSSDRMQGDYKQPFFEKMKVSLDGFGGMGRKTYWSEAVQVIKRRPFIGVGLNAYTLAGEKYNKVWHGYYAHNCYLQMAAEIGIAGLLLFFWIVGKAWVFTMRNLKSIDDEFYYVLTTGIFAGVVGFFVHGIFDTNFYSVQLVSLFWLFLGFLITVQMASFPSKNDKIIND